MMESVIRLENFYFAYNKSELVLQDIDLEIKKGSFTVVAGPSGAGKTTLCKAMTGIVPFYMGGRYSGDVQVLGESTKGRRVSDIAMRVGLMLEDYESQLVSLTAGEEVAFSLLNHGFAPEEVAERTRKALEDVGLPGRESYQLDELSGGQRQRLLLAATLAVHPEIIVLDEPVSALDVSIQAQVLNLMQQLQKDRGLTYLFISHNLSVVKHISDRIAVMYLGRMVELADCKQLFKNPVHPYTKALLSAVPIPRLDVKTERILLEGDVPSPVNPAPGCRFAGRCAQCMERCTAEQPELREIEPGHFVACHLCDR